MGDSRLVSTVKEIGSALTVLWLEEKKAVGAWLDDLFEDQLEISDEFKAKIPQAKSSTGD